MKKLSALASLLFLSACYTPLNNSGVATTKPWLDIEGKRVDFEGKQYDSCYRFNLRFWPQSAERALDGQQTCLSACCWRSEQEEVTLDFNKNFEQDLHRYGRARKYEPGQITLKVGHSSLLNTSSVKISPRGAVSQNGVIRLSYKEVEDRARLEELKAELRRQRVLQNAEQAEQDARREAYDEAAEQQRQENLARSLVQRRQMPAIDRYFFSLETAAKQKGDLFLLGRRVLTPTPLSPAVYAVDCRAEAQIGPDAQHLKKKTYPCGLWNADLQELTVQPANSRARKINAGK